MSGPCDVASQRHGGGGGHRAAGDPFDAPPPRRAAEEQLDPFTVSLDAYEGPLDLLLELARRNQIDLLKIRILPLAEQYLAYVDAATALRLEVAADILVMAAWLAYLKSRLLAPPAADGEPDGEALAEDLAFRLRLLQAMREAADALFARPRLGADVFPRGAPEEGVVTVLPRWKASLYDLLCAYGAVRQDEIVRTMTLEKRQVFSLVDARRVLERLVGGNAQWLPLEALVAAMPQGEDRRTVLASTFGAMLEMAREGQVRVRQAAPFAPLFVRAVEERHDG